MALSLQTMKADVRMVELMHTISIYEAWASRPWRLTSRWLNFVCTTCLMKESVRTGPHIVRTVAAVFPYLCFGKKSFNLSNTKRYPAVLLRRPDRCKLEQFEGSRHRGRSGWKVLVIWTDDAWTVERPNGISYLPDGCKGSEISDLEFVQNLLETYICIWRLWKYWNPNKKHHYMEVILSNRMQPITNRKCTNRL